MKSLKQKINDKGIVIGTWNTLGCPSVTDVLASAGLDFVIIDFEHGALDFKNILSYVNACLAYGVSPIVRVPSNEDWMINHALDNGAQGVIVPHVSNENDCDAIVSASKYYPVGKRGFTPFTKAGGYSALNVEEYTKNSNTEISNIVIVETLEGLEKIEEIISKENIDVIFLGSFDLSQELGHPGKTRSDEVLTKIKECVEKINAAGKIAGGYLANSREDIEWIKSLGIRFIVYKVDSAIIKDSIKSVISGVK